jgi:hypothetical protein
MVKNRLAQSDAQTNGWLLVRSTCVLGRFSVGHRHLLTHC